MVQPAESDINIPQPVNDENNGQRIEEVSNEVNTAPTRARNGFSMHFVKRRNGRDESRFWNRPCFAGYNMVAIGDSMLRSFGRKRHFIKGASINAFGGMDLYELISILRKGSLVSDLGSPKFRRELVEGKIKIPVIEKCVKCNKCCTKDFKGKLLIAVGINNSLHAADLPNIEINARNEYTGIQNVEGIYGLLDDTLAQLFPHANIKYAPILATKEDGWDTSELCQKVYNEMNQQIKLRIVFRNKTFY